MRIKGPMLDRLGSMIGGDRVFELQRMEEGYFRLEESCDCYYYAELTADELIALANELIEAALGQR